MPDPKTLHQDQNLTNFALVLGTGSFGAAAAMPVISVVHETDKYAIYGREHVSDDAQGLRAAGTSVAMLTYATTQGVYTAHEYSWGAIVPDRNRDNADVALDPFMAVTRILRNRVFLAWEKRAKTLLTTSGNFGTATAATGTGWADTTTGDPEKDVDTAREAVESTAGYTPNMIVIPPAKARAAKRHPKIRDIIKYTDPSLLVNGDLPPILWNLRVVIPGAIENTANPGQTAAIARVWNGTTVAVLYTDPNPSLEGATWGATFRVRTYGTNGQRVKNYRREDLDGNVVEYGTLQDERVISTACGALITGV